MIFFIKNILNNAELNQLKNYIITYKPNKFPSSTNEYYGQNISKDEIVNIQNKFLKLAETYVNSNLYVENITLNKVTFESNQNDSFHSDSPLLSLIVYLNDDFLGGRLEYIENDTSKFYTPNIHECVIINNKMLHKVEKVTQGERYAMVFFFNKIKQII